MHGSRWRTTSIVLAALLVAALPGLGALWASQRGGYANDSVEVGFTRDMYVHHEQAVVMALLVRERGSDPEVAALARDIVTGQAEQQGVMQGWLHAQGVSATSSAVPMAWAQSGGPGGHDMAGMGGTGPDDAGTGAAGADDPGADDPGTGDPGTDTRMGMASTEQLSELGRLSGTDADLRFVELMIRHHEGAVSMAESFEAVSDEPQLRWLSDGILTTQHRELRILGDLRTRLSG